MTIKNLGYPSKLAIRPTLMAMTLLTIQPFIFSATRQETQDRRATDAAQEQVIYRFQHNGVGGDLPTAGLIFDTAGNLYGTTGGGGIGACPSGCGVIFELSPQIGGGWSESALYDFKPDGLDGFRPVGPLVFDTAGNLYGTTFYGGDGVGCGKLGCGTVFELSPLSGGGWTESVLHSFHTNVDEGYNPYGSLIFDAAGNLYGVSSTGGPQGGGSVFELSPQLGGGWTEIALHNFSNQYQDPFDPAMGLVLDSAGNLYGATNSGGTCNLDAGGCGTIFELSPHSGGKWIEQTLFTFAGDNGAFPTGGLIFDSAGTLYGTTLEGGSGPSPGCGIAFELSPRRGHAWSETILYGFTGGAEGAEPAAGLIFDGAGNLYGATLFGGNVPCPNGSIGCGTVFELSPGIDGPWDLTSLHAFRGSGDDGLYPAGKLILDAMDNLYGSTSGGGNIHCYSGCGTIFEITP